ncbi:MAG: hypothetical protein JWP63_6260 [Candidatus Solibacter sp.]|nr:hypothetical protein [Candidatus Solibacter sp.]
MKCVWMALAVARVVLAGDFALQEYLPPDTKVVMGLRVRSLTESSLFAQNGQSAKSMSESWLKLATFTGFDPLHDIDEVLLTSAADKENAPALLVLRGRFNVEKLTEGAKLYHGVPLRTTTDKGATSVFGVLDATTALAGDGPLVRAAIDRRGQPAVYDRSLVERVASLRERFDLWGTGERPQGFIAPGGQNEQLNSIDRFEFGIRITNGLELGAEVHARSSKDTEKLAASLGLLQMMAKAQSNSAKFDVKVEDNTLKLSFAISEAELKKAIEAQQAQGRRTQTQPAQTQPTVVGQPVEAPRTQTATPGGTSVFMLPGKK